MIADRITGVILAAGLSSRMKGEFKPLLPLGETTLLERLIRLFQGNGIDHIQVVTGHRAAELIPLLQPLGVQWVRNEDYRAGMLDRNLRDLMRTGRRSLAMGLAVLAACIAIGQLVLEVFAHSTLVRPVAEGLIIFGWVANWRPAEIFLYDIWAARRRIDLYRRLSTADVELRASN